MSRAAAEADLGIEGLLDRSGTTETGEQRGVNVDQPFWIGLDQHLRHDPHPTGHHHQIDPALLKGSCDSAIEFLSACDSAVVQDERWDLESCGSAERPAGLTVDHQQNDLSWNVAVAAGVNEGLEIAAFARCHHAEAKGLESTDGSVRWQRPLDGPAPLARVWKSGRLAMSHLSILPTVLQDETLLARALADLNFEVQWGGELIGFADERQAVVLSVAAAGDQRLGWSRQKDGSLGLVGDLQRLGRSTAIQSLIAQITRRYAVHQALQAAGADLSAAQVELVG